jgi:hypothetical protein
MPWDPSDVGYPRHTILGEEARAAVGTGPACEPSDAARGRIVQVELGVSVPIGDEHKELA